MSRRAKSLRCRGGGLRLPAAHARSPGPALAAAAGLGADAAGAERQRRDPDRGEHRPAALRGRRQRELPIASTTKMMTALVTLQHVRHLDRCSPQNDWYAVAADSQIGLVPGRADDRPRPAARADAAERRRRRRGSRLQRRRRLGRPVRRDDERRRARARAHATRTTRRRSGSTRRATTRAPRTSSSSRPTSSSTTAFFARIVALPSAHLDTGPVRLRRQPQRPRRPRTVDQRRQDRPHRPAPATCWSRPGDETG